MALSMLIAAETPISSIVAIVVVQITPRPSRKEHRGRGETRGEESRAATRNKQDPSAAAAPRGHPPLQSGGLESRIRMLSPADTDAASELLPVQRRRLRVEILSPWLRASLSWRSARLGARGRRGNGEGDVTAGYLLLVPLSRSVCEIGRAHV